MVTNSPQVDRPAPSPAVARWGHSIRGRRHGFLLIPHALLRYQARLKMTDGELLVAQNILMHWNFADPNKLPFIPTTRIAERMGAKLRTVQRHIQGLEKKGLLRRVTPEVGADGVLRRRFDLSGLVDAVRRHAGENLDAASTQEKRPQSDVPPWSPGRISHEAGKQP
jgi:hypothetical protein